MQSLWATALLKLQNIDERIRKVRTRLSLMPAERNRIIAAKNAAEAKVAAAEKTLASHLDLLRRTEAEIKALEEKRNRIRQQSALVKKNAEYQSMMAESAMLDQAIGKLEIQVLTEMEKTPAKEAAVAEAKKVCAGELRALKQEYIEFGNAEKSFRQDLENLKAERLAATENLERKILDPYEELLKSNDGNPLVPILEGGVCGNCSLQLTPQTLSSAKAGKFIFCDNCSHLIYFEDL
jgi:predicted  nucleic acid-binding Zn-ribbon protein